MSRGSPGTTGAWDLGEIRANRGLVSHIGAPAAGRGRRTVDNYTKESIMAASRTTIRFSLPSSDSLIETRSEHP
jgi:hypothetical protein